jgi:hypothetical protein
MKFKRQRGFVDGISMIILITSYMLIKIGVDETGGRGSKESYEKSMEQQIMDVEDHKFHQMQEKKIKRDAERKLGRDR